MASVRSRIPPQSSLFSCFPRLGRNRPGGIPSGLRQQQRAAAASVFPVALSAVSGYPSPRRIPRLPLRLRSLPYMEQWALYQRFLSVQTTSRMRQVSRPASQSQLPLRCHLPSFTLSLPFPPRAGGSSYAHWLSALHRSTLYSVSSVLCIFLFLQCFPQLYRGNAASSCVFVPSLLYAISSFGELDLPSAACSCAIGASSSFSCSHLSAQHLRLNVRAKGPPICLLSSVPPIRFPSRL